MSDSRKLPQQREHKTRVASLGHIGVLMGGCSSERSISLKSGKAIFKALHECGCDVSSIDITSSAKSDITALLKDARIDIVFIALHGRFGEDGTIQSILEKIDIPYTGSGVVASQNALSKITAQELFKENGIPVPEYTVVRKDVTLDIESVLRTIGNLPVVVKPANEGSSIGITIVDDKSELSVALDSAFQYDKDVLVERYIKGRELTVGILADRPLPVVEIKPKNPFFDFSAKYEVGMTQYIVPADIPPAVSKQIQSVSLKAHHALGCSDFSRVDLIIDEGNKPYILEVNTIPGFTETSLLPKAARAAGLDFKELCLTIAELAYAKQK